MMFMDFPMDVLRFTYRYRPPIGDLDMRSIRGLGSIKQWGGDDSSCFSSNEGYLITMMAKILAVNNALENHRAIGDGVPMIFASERPS